MSLPTPVDGAAPGYFGVYPAIVTDLLDPDSLGRVEVSFPWLGEDDENDVRAWATLASPYADNNQGLMIVPEVDSQVVVAFEAGNLRRPYVIGSAWNGRASQPENPSTANNLRLLKSRAGSRLEFDDSTGSAKITLTTSAGVQIVLEDSGKATVSTPLGHKVTLDDTGQQVSVSHALGCSVSLSATSVSIQGNVSVSVTAPTVKVDAAFVQFSGVVQATTLMATTSVVSPSYTPGAGNLM